MDEARGEAEAPVPPRSDGRPWSARAPWPDGRAARPRSAYDAVVFDLDGVIADTSATSLDDTSAPRAFADAVALLHRLRRQGIPTAVVTASPDGTGMLAAAGVTDLVEVLVDGTDALRLALPAPPDPAILLEAARRLSVAPGAAVAVGESAAGVRAAATGGFALVVGVDRSGGDRLRLEGADLLVADLGELDVSLEGDDGAFAGGESGSRPWLLRYDGFDPDEEGTREALCTLGDGYWATRGAAPECDADAAHYPGTYLAGIYNRLSTRLDDRTVEDEHLVNAPNWLPLRFRLEDGDWLRPDTDVVEFRQELDLRRGLLTRVIRFRDALGRTTRLTDRRFVSMGSGGRGGIGGLGVLESSIEAENWAGHISVQSAIDGRVANRNVAEYWMLADRHLSTRDAREVGPETLLLEMETTQSGIHIAMAARTRARVGGRLAAPHRRVALDPAGWVAHEFDVLLEPGRPLAIEKVVTVATSRDRAVSSPADSVTTWLSRAADTDDLLAEHERAWQILWDEFGVHTHASERRSLALNLNIFHVLQTVAASETDLDAGVPARGLHGEAYRGHIFWDEVFVYPMLTLRRPGLSRALLGYRYRRLAEARMAAREAGFDGAMFPWQSGIDGREETPGELFNPLSAGWMPDNSRRQRHVGIAIAYSVWQYYEVTGDTAFLLSQGAELLIEVARFFASAAEYDAVADRYDISGVMGPDEFHDGYPGAAGQGLRNNAYTNVMTAWILRRAADTVGLLASRYARPLWNRLQLRADEADRWLRISRRLRVPFHADGVISQFEGYEALPEFDWAGYRARYASLKRLDLILDAEGDSTNNYRLAKQADVLMLLYLLSAEELRDLLHDMGYAFPPEAVAATVAFYSERSSHGSTLSNVVHSWVEARGDRERSWAFLGDALTSDLVRDGSGTTQEGVHLGAMAGSVDMVVRCYTGLEFRGGRLWLHPVIPPELGEVSFTLIYRDQPVRIEVSATVVSLSLSAGVVAPITVVVEGQEAVLAPGVTREFRLARGKEGA